MTHTDFDTMLKFKAGAGVVPLAAWVRENETAIVEYPRLLKSLACIRQWAQCGIKAVPPYDRNIAQCLKDIEREADAAIKANQDTTK